MTGWSRALAVGATWLLVLALLVGVGVAFGGLLQAGLERAAAAHGVRR